MSTTGFRADNHRLSVYELESLSAPRVQEVCYPNVPVPAWCRDRTFFFMHFLSRILFCARAGGGPALGRAAAAPEPGSAELPRPLTLDQALAYAAAHSPGLRRVRAQLAQQEGGQLEADARRSPRVSLTGGYAYTDPNLEESLPGFPQVPLPQQDAWIAQLSVRQSVYSGGSVQAGVAGAREQTQSARLALTAAMNDTALAVRRSFYGVLLAREQIRVHEESLKVLDGELAQARVRQSAGTGSDFDVLRAEVAVANARPALVRARNTYHTRQDQLRAVLGAESPANEEATDLEVAGELAVPRLEAHVTDALRTARTSRPELLAQEHAMAAAATEVTAAKAGNRPQVNLVAGYESRKASYSSSFASTLNGWTAGLQADWTLFDGQATAGKVRRATARVSQAAAIKDELRQRIDLEVRAAHTAVGEASELMGSAEQVIGQAAESLRLAQARFAAGTANQLDVLAAQTALTEARSNLAQAQYDYAVAVAGLRHAMGTAD